MSGGVPRSKSGAHSWCFACPEGHQGPLESVDRGNSYRCRSCNSVYDGSPRDLREEESDSESEVWLP